MSTLTPQLLKRFEPFILCLLILLAVVVRWWAIRDNHIFFHFDQARDAFVAEHMVTERDLKLQGPSASGTNETVYHGVLFYYVLAPLYAVALGNPYTVTLWLSILGATAVLPVYLLVKDMSESRGVATLAAGLVALSFEHTLASTWLSNPTLVATLSLWFYWSLWQVFFRHRSQWWWLVAITLGLNHQAVIVMVFLWLSVIVAAAWQNAEAPAQARKLWQPAHVLGFLGLYTLSISTMILVQLRLIWQHIFTFSSLQQATTGQIHQPGESLMIVLDMYLRKIGLTFFPSWPVLSLLLTIVVIWLAYTRLNRAVFSFLSLWWLAPLGLFALHTRNAYHALLGLEVPLLIALCLVLAKSQPTRKWLAGGLLSLVSISQIMSIALYHNQHLVTFSVERGLMLDQELAVLRETASYAQGQPFSLSALTTPYGYPVTWAYLFHWYTKSHPDYTPLWLGNDQTGTLWEHDLPKTPVRLQKHVTLEEKVSGIEPWMQATFTASQPVTRSAQLQLGGVVVTEY